MSPTLLETHFKVWVEEGILHARKTRPVAVADDRIHAPVVAPMQYAIHIRHFYSNDGISFHRESWDPRGKVYTNLKEANEEARWMALEALARDEDEEELKDELEEINVGSSRKLYQGEAQLSPFLYNDPVSAAIRVVELKVNDPLAANHAVPTTANAGRQTKRPRYL